jgi:hypothetical protein
MPIKAPNQFEFTQPRPDDIAWRYMTLAKLLSLVLDKRLYLARLDQMSDKLEGQFTADEYRWLDGRVPWSARHRRPQEDAEKPGRIVGSMHAYDRAQRYRTRVFVNCWHVGDETEHEAMWRIYGSGETGLAIQVSVS